ncbi:MAG TPA: MBL fold metallo-hydrolase [Streptosporangiaceae bacterium]|nr:MBL fold metallo-hydrolase [Streptosporangiaceae bacterium]
MRVTVVGCAGSYPSAVSAGSCYLLEAEGFRMLIDLGTGALGPLQRYVDLSGIDAICVSHLHADHCLDLHAYRVARQYGPAGLMPPIPVYGPAGTAERIALVNGTDGDDGLTARFTFGTLTPGKREIGPFQLTTAHMNHPVETFGFRVQHDGWTLAYSADTGESAALVELARSADLLLCEAAYLDGLDNRRDVHLSGREAGEHAAKAGVGALVLTHLVAGKDPDRSFAEASGAFAGPLSLACPGATFGPDAASR